MDASALTYDKAGTTRLHDPQLKELHHFAEFGRLSAGLLHEISAPLTAAVLHLEQSDDLNFEHIKNARRQIMLLQRYVDAARQQIRQESVVTNFSVRSQLEQIRHVLVPLARRHQIKIEFNQTVNIRISGDPVKFQQIMSNLILDSIHAYKVLPNTSNELRVINVSVVAINNKLVIRVHDRGIGISPEQIPLLFKPFYSTKSQSGHGLGLGLAVVRQYVYQDFHGVISVSSSARHGTSFTIKLKLHETGTRSISGTVK